MIVKKKLESMWLNPPTIFRSAPFWSWNGELDPKRLCRQIESMNAAGMGGFFMHSRYGLKTEYLGKDWFACISACIEKARLLGMKAYLYDEDRWPSGAAGGILTRKNTAHRLRYIVGDSPKNIRDQKENIEKTFGTFAVELDGGGLLKSYCQTSEKQNSKSSGKILSFQSRTQSPSPWENNGTYIDTLNADTVAEYIRSTHEEYAKRYSKDFGNLIPAIFTDEPNYGADRCYNRDQKQYRLPWTDRLPEEFKTRCGYDILQYLPELFVAYGDGRFSKVRHDYYRTVTELFVENYTRQIGQWCEKHGLPLTGHMLLEGTLKSQIEAVGACMPHYEYMQWPGIDLLTDQCSELATAKQCSSVADQLGKERVLTELYGCTGWDWPLEGHKFIADWQFAAGINFLCPHLTHYSLAGGAKRDYPASIIDHSPWWKYYKVVQDYLARLSLMLTQGKSVRDVLVIHPVESAWGLFGLKTPEDIDPVEKMHKAMDSIIFTLSGSHYDWDFADESLLAKYGKVKTDTLGISKMQYKLVIVPPLVTLRSTTVAVLEKFIKAGGQVVFVDSQPTHIDGKPNEKIDDLLARSIHCGLKPKVFISQVEKLLPRRVSITEKGKEQTCLWSMLREIDGGQLLFVQSHDRKASHNVTIKAANAKMPVVMWDLLSGKKTVLKTKSDKKQVKFDISLASSGSTLITMGVNVSDASPQVKELKVVSTKKIKGPFDIELMEPNSLPLDYCSYRFGKGKFSELMPTLKADKLIRQRYGLGTRLGMEQQPWYLYATGVVDKKPCEQVQMKYAFHITDLPRRCLLAVERPHDYVIAVNGKKAGDCGGWWVDEDIRTVDITTLLQNGVNEVKLTFNYRSDMELEDMYLVGDFGVSRLYALQPTSPGNATVVKPTTQLNVGSWVGQGLDFYGGAVRYKFTVKRPDKGKRLKISLPNISCTAAVIHVGQKTFVLPWAPFDADITESLVDDNNKVVLEIIGGRKNILGPLHVPPQPWTGPEHFNPDHQKWTFEYQLSHHGLMSFIQIESMQ